jgi:hypothetical protein
MAALGHYQVRYTAMELPPSRRSTPAAGARFGASSSWSRMSGLSPVPSPKEQADGQRYARSFRSRWLQSGHRCSRAVNWLLPSRPNLTRSAPCQRQLNHNPKPFGTSRKLGRASTGASATSKLAKHMAGAASGLFLEPHQPPQFL